MFITKCILCDSSDLSLALDLGFHPLADTFLKEEQLREPEVRYPLQMLLCKTCGHAMASYIVPATERYQLNDYSYDSGNSKVSVAHFAEMAQDIITRAKVEPTDIVVDIGSSVGTLLEAFRSQSGAQVIGVEPAANIVALAIQKNIPTIHDFFGPRAITEIQKHGKAKVITITNVFNHIAEPGTCMRDVNAILSDDGVFVIEVPYLLPLVQKLAFDTIYLEHISYFAIKPLIPFFQKYNLVITDIQEQDYMGGSVRITVARNSKESPKVSGYIAREEAAHLFDLNTYAQMSQKMSAFRIGLLRQLLDAQAGGGTIIGIGAATKGNTLLNYCGINRSLITFVTDASPLKIGKYTPGSHIPIVPDEAITKAVTHAVILPWNISAFLKEKLSPKFPHMTFIVPHM